MNIGILPFFVYFVLLYYINQIGLPFNEQVVISLVVSFISAIIGKIILNNLDDDYYVEGLFDALWKKFWWNNGMQIMGIVFGFVGSMYFLYRYNIGSIDIVPYIKHAFSSFIEVIRTILNLK